MVFEFNRVNHPSMPYTRIPSQILKGSASVSAVALSSAGILRVNNQDLSWPDPNLELEPSLFKEENV